MFSISHWGMFDLPYNELESYWNFVWYFNLGGNFSVT